MEEPVSILTLTNNTRKVNLELLLENIINQTYNNVTELYLLETDNVPENISDNKLFIEEIYNKFRDRIKFNIYYYIHEYQKDEPILSEQQLLNIGEQKSVGTIIVRMYDDTYYFPSYIKDGIESLNKVGKKFGCSSKPYMYDVLLKYMIVCNDRILNSSFIYYKSYLINNETDKPLELECKFVKIIDANNYTLYRNEIYKHVFEKTTLDLNILPDKYKNINNYVIDYCPYDIVYLNGLHTVGWDPRHTNLGGSEQAIVKLSEEWVKLNKTVVVYGNFPFDKITHNNIDYYNIILFPLHQKIKNLICWRTNGLIFLVTFNIYINNLIMDFHDNFSYTLEKLQIDMSYHLLEKSNYIMLKSDYHKKCYIDYLNKYDKKIDLSKLLVINNGVRVDEFSVKPNVIREPYRFCYCSSYDRGLEIILKYIWPHIYKQEPDAELHVYYGMDYIGNTEFMNNITFLMGQPGVMDHGRKSSKHINKEKYTSTFHIYITTSIAEIDCISVKESLVTGCIPLLYNFGVFKERDGIKYDLPLYDDDKVSEENLKTIADDIVSKMKNFELIDNMRNLLKDSDTILSWEQVAKEWINIFY